MKGTYVMKVTSHHEGKDLKEIVASLRAHADAFEKGITLAGAKEKPMKTVSRNTADEIEDDDAPVAKATKAKAEKAPAKKAKAKAEEEEEFDLGEDEDEEEDDVEADDEEEEDEEESEDEEEEEDEDGEVSLSDVQTALKKYAAKNTRAKAEKVLAKFGVKSVNDLKPKFFEKALAALK